MPASWHHLNTSPLSNTYVICSFMSPNYSDIFWNIQFTIYENCVSKIPLLSRLPPSLYFSYFLPVTYSEVVCLSTNLKFYRHEVCKGISRLVKEKCSRFINIIKLLIDVNTLIHHLLRNWKLLVRYSGKPQTNNKLERCHDEYLRCRADTWHIKCPIIGWYTKRTHNFKRC